MCTRKAPLRRKRKPIADSYLLVTEDGEQFGPFKSQAQANLFAAVRWPAIFENHWRVEKQEVGCGDVGTRKIR